MPPTNSLVAVVLAAGKGKRLKSAVPKVLHPICGRPALWWALQDVRAARPSKIVIVVHHGADEVREAVRTWGVVPEPVFVEQGEALGTGHAVLAAEKAVGRASEVLIANGDFDPVAPEDVRTLIRVHRRTKAAATMITTEVERPGSYSRIVRDGDRLVSIVEGSDAPASMRSIREVGTNWIVFRREDLFRALPLVGRENSQGEHYLNDVFPILIEKGERVSVLLVDTGGAMGINSRADLGRTTRVLRERINARHLANGVTLEDPETTYIDEGVRIGRDTVIHPMTFLSGETRIARGCEIGPATRVVDTSVAEGASVQFSVVSSSRIGARAQVGPYAHVRPGTRLGSGHQGRLLRRDQGVRGRRGREGAAPDLRRGREGRPAGQHRGRDRDGQLRRVREASDADRGRCAGGFGYDARGAGEARQGGGDGRGIGDHDGRPGGCARGGAFGATGGQGLPQAA